MNVTDRLDQLRAEFPHCQVAAFADMSTAMVLSASAPKKTTQEDLDALCRTGAELLHGETSHSVSQAAGPAFKTMSQSFVIQQNVIEIFIRSQSDPVDMICCICDVGAPISSLAERVCTILDDIAQGVAAFAGMF